MLRFIYLADYNKGLAIKFQYISCYGLSAAFSSLAIISPRFQYISCYGLSSFKECEDAKQIIFQYISCYGLSGFRGNESGWNFAFQYISCYGLSDGLRDDRRMFSYFNTSHVTVYPLTINGWNKERKYFNTSHVTVYLHVIMLI